MGDQYPEIKDKQSQIERVIKGEEESFNNTLDRGIEEFERLVGGLVGKYLGNKYYPGKKFDWKISEELVIVFETKTSVKELRLVDVPQLIFIEI